MGFCSWKSWVALYLLLSDICVFLLFCYTISIFASASLHHCKITVGRETFQFIIEGLEGVLWSSEYVKQNEDWWGGGGRGCYTCSITKRERNIWYSTKTTSKICLIIWTYTVYCANQAIKNLWKCISDFDMQYFLLMWLLFFKACKYCSKYIKN